MLVTVFRRAVAAYGKATGSPTRKGDFPGGISFAPEAAAHIDDVGESGGSEKFGCLEGTPSLLTPCNAFGALVEILLHNLHKPRIELHPPIRVRFHHGNVLGAGDVSGIEFRRRPDIQVDVPCVGLQELLGVLRGNPFYFHVFLPLLKLEIFNYYSSLLSVCRLLRIGTSPPFAQAKIQLLAVLRVFVSWRYTLRHQPISSNSPVVLFLRTLFQ